MVNEIVIIKCEEELQSKRADLMNEKKKEKKNLSQLLAISERYSSHIEIVEYSVWYKNCALYQHFLSETKELFDRIAKQKRHSILSSCWSKGMALMAHSHRINYSMKYHTHTYT